MSSRTRLVAVAIAAAALTSTASAQAQTSAPHTVSGTVNADLSITVGSPSTSLGTFTPLLTASQNTGSVPVTITSTAARANVSLVDPDATATKGYLLNSTSGPDGAPATYSLLNPLQARAGTAAFAPLTSAVALFTDDLTPGATAGQYSQTTNVDFLQTINANEGLRTGTYSKGLTFSVSTLLP